MTISIERLDNRLRKIEDNLILKEEFSRMNNKIQNMEVLLTKIFTIVEEERTKNDEK
jgi:hypothetical protein